MARRINKNQRLYSDMHSIKSMIGPYIDEEYLSLNSGRSGTEYLIGDEKIRARLESIFDIAGEIAEYIGCVLRRPPLALVGKKTKKVIAKK